MINKIIIILTIIIFISSCNINKKTETSELSSQIKFDETYSVTEVIRKNQTFSDLLLPYVDSYDTVLKIAEISDTILDTRKIKANKKISYQFSKSNKDSLVKIIYHKSPFADVIIDLKDSINVYEWKKEIEKKEKTVSGIVENSLYQTIQDSDLPIELALKLSEIYAWQIDFFLINKGDSFTVVYDEITTEDGYKTLGEIKASVFNHYNKEYYAFSFNNSGKKEYFDEQGNSLQKQFLKAPLKFSRISSGFSNSRFHPILRYYRPHHGIDYAAPSGTPVQAVGSGTVIAKTYGKSSGYIVKIKHNSVYRSSYMHLMKFEKGITVGSKVNQGDIIGYVGSTGLSTGPHLDFRFYINETPVNYLTIEFPPAFPVDITKQSLFNIFKEEYKTKLKYMGGNFTIENSPKKNISFQ